ncbi:MAG: hypothetical protein JSS76_12480 [Bacteroidetes bacterium]|nr:hypothetical protein [Bacteroidota bacterium]
MQSYITRYVQVNGAAIHVDGGLYYRGEASGAEFLAEAYKGIGLDYPKFYKMDPLSRLAVLATEMLLKGRKITQEYKPEDVAVIVTSAHSSLDTDLRYQQSVATAPSPSLFVYTLPNVMIGEVCIRQGIKGENTCFVSADFDPEFQAGYVNGLLVEGRAEVCISGRADYLRGGMNAFFMLVEKNPASLGEYNTQTIKQLYDRQWKN